MYCSLHGARNRLDATIISIHSHLGYASQKHRMETMTLPCAQRECGSVEP